MDMCSINPAFLGKPYRYAYACGAVRPCNFPNTLTKVISTPASLFHYHFMYCTLELIEFSISELQLDLVDGKAKNWYDEGAVPSEPFFVARPGATEEDDGKFIPNLFSYYQNFIFVN